MHQASMLISMCRSHDIFQEEVSRSHGQSQRGHCPVWCVIAPSANRGNLGLIGGTITHEYDSLMHGFAAEVDTDFFNNTLQTNFKSDHSDIDYIGGQTGFMCRIVDLTFLQKKMAWSAPSKL
jgi:hypothetical protein